MGVSLSACFCGGHFFCMNRTTFFIVYCSWASVSVRVITGAALMMGFVSTSRFIKKPNKQHGYLGGMEARLDPSVAEMGPCEYCFVSRWGL